MNLETLLLAMALVLAAVFNVILPWVRRLQEDGQAGNVDPGLRQTQPTALAPAPMASLTSEPQPEPEPAPRRKAAIRPAASVALAGARPARRTPLGSRSALRNGIVFAAVLGPCRAQTPFV